MAQPSITQEPEEKLATEVAYELLLSEIRAVPESEIVQINIDIMTAVTSVLGSLPEIRALRSEIEGAFRSFDLARFDKLESYTLALSHAHAVYRAATEPKSDTVEVANELSRLRDRLLADAQSLANHGFIDGERLKQCKQTPGYRPIASDILMLATVFKERWAAIEGKTPVTLALINEAGGKALQLLSAVGLRDQAPAIAGDAAVVRQKAFTLFVRTYDSARRAVQYLRPKGDDADNIAPSLYSGRGGRRRDEPEPHVTPGLTLTTPHAGAVPASLAIENKSGLPITNPLNA